MAKGNAEAGAGAASTSNGSRPYWQAWTPPHLSFPCC